MIAWAQHRVNDEGVAAQVALQTADVLELPCEANRFDALICKSVLVFVPDQLRAIRECVRVTRPGGYVGLNGGIWIAQPVPEVEAQVKEAIGPKVPTLDEWEALWEASDLQERLVRANQIDARQEVKGRIEWIGWRRIVRAQARARRLYLSEPASRAAIWLAHAGIAPKSLNHTPSCSSA